MMDEDISTLLEWAIANQKNVHVDKEAVLKELRQIPSCDGLSCFYCKEWAQMIFKCFFQQPSMTATSSAGSTSHSSNSSGNSPLSSSTSTTSSIKKLASGGLHHLLGDVGLVSTSASDNDDDSKRPAEFICVRIEKYVRHDPFSQNSRRSQAESSESVVDMVDELLLCFRDWLDAKPSPWKTQDVIKPLVLTPPSLSSDEILSKDKLCLQFLRAITTDKKGYNLTRSDIHKLRPVFTEDALAPKDYYCHDRSTSTLPADLDLEVSQLNDRFLTMSKAVEAELSPKLKDQWTPIEHLIVFIRDNLAKLEDIVGASAVQSSLHRHLQSASMSTFLPFDNYWSSYAETAKKSGNATEINGPSSAILDDAFANYLQFYRNVLGQDGLISEAYRISNQLSDYIASFSDVFFARVQQIDIPRNKELVVQIESEARSSVQNLNSITDTRIREIIEDMQGMKDELMQAMDEIELMYKGKGGSSNAIGRLERVSKSQMRRRIKKLESHFQQMTKLFVSSMTTAFPSFYLVLVVYMIVKFFVYENTGRESDIVGNAIARRLDDVKKLVQDCTNTKSAYHVGVTNGALELSIVYVKVFYREIQRQYYDWKALKAQSSLLKSLEAEESAKAKKSKKKKKKEAKESGTSTPVTTGDGSAGPASPQKGSGSSSVAAVTPEKAPSTSQPANSKSQHSAKSSSASAESGLSKKQDAASREKENKHPNSPNKSRNTSPTLGDLQKQQQQQAQKLAQAQSVSEADKKEISRLNRENERLVTQLDEMSLKLATSESSQMSLKNELSTLNRKYAQLTKFSDELEKQLNEHKNNGQEMALQLRGKNGEISRLEELVRSLEGKLADAERALASRPPPHVVAPVQTAATQTSNAPPQPTVSPQPPQERDIPLPGPPPGLRSASQTKVPIGFERPSVQPQHQFQQQPVGVGMFNILQQQRQQQPPSAVQNAQNILTDLNQSLRSIFDSAPPTPMSASQPGVIPPPGFSFGPLPTQNGPDLWAASPQRPRW